MNNQFGELRNEYKEFYVTRTGKDFNEFAPITEFVLMKLSELQTEVKELKSLLKTKKCKEVK